MAGFDLKKIVSALKAADAFSDEQLELIEAAGSELITWSPDDFSEQVGLSRLEGMSAQRLVRDAFGTLGVSEERRYEIPESPPYLKNPGWAAKTGKVQEDGTTTIMKAASTGDYDPSDPMQFAQIGDQFWRWDGQRSTRWPYGRPREVTFVDHRIVEGVPVPDPIQASAAIANGQEWFHKGYDCWIRWNGKRSVEMTRAKLTSVRNVTGPRARVTA